MPDPVEVHVHNHIHLPGDAGEITDRLAAIEAAIMQEVTAMSDIDLRITNLATEVSETRDAVESAKTVFAGVLADLAAAREEMLRRGVTDEQLAALDAITDGLDAVQEDLATSIVTGTPAEEPTDEPEPAEEPVDGEPEPTEDEPGF